MLFILELNILMSKLKIFFKYTPFWYWIFIPFIYKYFEQFPIERINEDGVYLCETLQTNYFGGSSVYSSFKYEGKMYKAYVKTRVKTCLASLNIHPELGVEYQIYKKENHENDV